MKRQRALGVERSLVEVLFERNAKRLEEMRRDLRLFGPGR